MRRPDPDLPLIFDRAEALSAGLSEEQVRRRAATRWDRLRRGQFTTAQLDAEHRWRAEVLATSRAHRRPLVLSHAAAARARGLPSPLGGWPPTTFTSSTGCVRQAGLAIVLVAALSDDEVAAHGAIRSTSAARTVVDCARRLAPRDALAMADAALRRGLTDCQALRTVLDRQSGWKGVAQARRVLELADGRRETPFESWSAWAFAVLGVPQPVWQVADHGRRRRLPGTRRRLVAGRRRRRGGRRPQVPACGRRTRGSDRRQPRGGGERRAAT